MVYAFHLDRLNALKQSQVIENAHYTGIKSEALQDNVDILFPRGISRHGKQYLFSNNLKTDANNRIEIIFEDVRKSQFPERFSRFESFFAFETPDDIYIFKKKFNIVEGKIWIIESSNRFKADMNLLSLDKPLLETSSNAQRYWEGASSTIPFWELLLLPPVNIIKPLDVSWD